MRFAAFAGSPPPHRTPAVNPRLSAEELSHFEKLLRQRESELRGEILQTRQRASDETFRDVASEAPDLEDAALADLVCYLNTAVIVRDVVVLRAIAAALGRVEAGSYGVCLRCGGLIPRQRLEAFPTAKYDVQHQEERDGELGSPPTPTL